MSFIDKLGEKLFKGGQNKKKPKITAMEQKILQYCMKPRTSSQIIQLFPARSGNVLGMIEKLKRDGLIIQATNKYKTTVDKLEFDTVMTITSDTKTKKKADNLFRMEWPYYTLVNGKLIDDEGIELEGTPKFETTEEAEQWLIDNDERGNVKTSEKEAGIKDWFKKKKGDEEILEDRYGVRIVFDNYDISRKEGAWSWEIYDLNIDKSGFSSYPEALKNVVQYLEKRIKEKDYPYTINLNIQIPSELLKESKIELEKKADNEDYYEEDLGKKFGVSVQILEDGEGSWYWQIIETDSYRTRFNSFEEARKDVITYLEDMVSEGDYPYEYNPEIELEKKAAKPIDTKGIVTNKFPVIWRKDFSIWSEFVRQVKYKSEYVAYISESPEGNQFEGVIDPYGSDQTIWGDIYGSFEEAKKELLDEIEAMKKLDIMWNKESKLTDEAQEFISKEIEHLVKDKGYSQERAVGAAYAIAREKGYDVPKKKSNINWKEYLNNHLQRADVTELRNMAGLVLGESLQPSYVLHNASAVAEKISAELDKMDKKDLEEIYNSRFIKSKVAEEDKIYKDDDEYEKVVSEIIRKVVGDKYSITYANFTADSGIIEVNIDDYMLSINFYRDEEKGWLFGGIEGFYLPPTGEEYEEAGELSGYFGGLDDLENTLNGALQQLGIKKDKEADIIANAISKYNKRIDNTKEAFDYDNLYDCVIEGLEDNCGISRDEIVPKELDKKIGMILKGERTTHKLLTSKIGKNPGGVLYEEYRKLYRRLWPSGYVSDYDLDRLSEEAIKKEIKQMKKEIKNKSSYFPGLVEKNPKGRSEDEAIEEAEEEGQQKLPGIESKKATSAYEEWWGNLGLIERGEILYNAGIDEEEHEELIHLNFSDYEDTLQKAIIEQLEAGVSIREDDNDEETRNGGKGLYVGEQLEGEISAKKADKDIKVIDINDATEEQATNFYEYPSFKIFDGNHVYLLAEYQLIIENGTKYIITDDVSTVNKKLSGSTLDLDWETSAYNFDIREKKADSWLKKAYSKKEYIQFADLLKRLPDNVDKKTLIDELSRMFANENPNFDVDRFVKYIEKKESKIESKQAEVESNKKATQNKQALWKDKLQNVYESLEEFKQYDEMYSLIERLGFDTPEEAWEANPMIEGSVNPEDYKVVGNIALDRTEGRPGGSYEEFNDALVGAKEEEGLLFSKENLQKTIDEVVESGSTKEPLRWIGLAGGKDKLLKLLSNLTKSYKVEIPDEFFDIIDEASKEWQAIPEGSMVKTRPWGTANKAEKAFKVGVKKESSTREDYIIEKITEVNRMLKERNIDLNTEDLLDTVIQSIEDDFERRLDDEEKQVVENILVSGDKKQAYSKKADRWEEGETVFEVKEKIFIPEFPLSEMLEGEKVELYQTGDDTFEIVEQITGKTLPLHQKKLNELIYGKQLERVGNKKKADMDFADLVDEFVAWAERNHEDITVDNFISFIDSDLEEEVSEEEISKAIREVEKLEEKEDKEIIGNVAGKVFKCPICQQYFHPEEHKECPSCKQYQWAASKKAFVISISEEDIDKEQYEDIVEDLKLIVMEPEGMGQVFKEEGNIIVSGEDIAIEDSIKDYLEGHGIRTAEVDKDDITVNSQKKFNVQYNIGKAKYVVNFHDGVKKYEDGSDFYDIRIFNNKKDFEQFQQKLLSEGYGFKLSARGEDNKVSRKDIVIDKTLLVTQSIKETLETLDESNIDYVKEQIENNLYDLEGWFERNKTASKKKATGEADQDYDHEFFDEIVKQLDAAGYSGATHKEFDKYQGVYLRVPNVGKFWVADTYVTGKRIPSEAPYRDAYLIDEEGNKSSASHGDYFQFAKNYVFEGYTLVLIKHDGTKEEFDNPTVAQLPDLLAVDRSIKFRPGSEIFVYVFAPEDNPDYALEVTQTEDNKVDASQLVEYIKEQKGGKEV